MGRCWQSSLDVAVCVRALSFGSPLCPCPCIGQLAPVVAGWLQGHRAHDHVLCLLVSWFGTQVFPVAAKARANPHSRYLYPDPGTTPREPTGDFYQVSVDAKAAAAIAKLKSKVERLRRERDEAEQQAAAWFREEQEKLARSQQADASPFSATTISGGGISSSGGSVGQSTVGSENGTSGGGGGGGIPGGGRVVASLRAEGLKLKRELQEAREEADRLRRLSSQGTMDGSAGSVGREGDPSARALNGLEVRVSWFC